MRNNCINLPSSYFSLDKRKWWSSAHQMFSFSVLFSKPQCARRSYATRRTLVYYRRILRLLFFKKDRFFIPYRGLLFFCYLPLKAFALYKHANRKFQRKLYTKWAQKKEKKRFSWPWPLEICRERGHLLLLWNNKVEIGGNNSLWRR